MLSMIAYFIIWTRKLKSLPFAIRIKYADGTTQMSGTSGLELAPEVLDARHWTLVGEGAVHIVVKYIGVGLCQGSDNGAPNKPQVDSQNDNDGRDDNIVSAAQLRAHVVRIPKNVVAAKSISETEALHSDRLFCRAMKCAEHYSLLPFKLDLPTTFLQSLDAHLLPIRDPSRTTGAGIDSARQLGWLLPNTTFLFKSLTHIPQPKLDVETVRRQTMSVELKPKCGKLPPAEFVTNRIKLRHSKFFMKQLLKVQTQKQGAKAGNEGVAHVRRSYYDPLLLFSGNAELISAALWNLVVTPQNNFRVFGGGRQIFSQSQAASGVSLADTLVLFSQTCTEKFTNSIVWTEDKLVNVVRAILFKDEFLARLLSVQKLDDRGIEFVGLAYSFLTTIADQFVESEVGPLSSA